MTEAHGERPRRPRDELGRPLPWGSTGVEPVPEEALPPSEALALAERLVRQGRPFGAHEVLEASWKAAPADERAFWQGLAQVCVGLTHAARGNSVGAARLLARGAGRLTEHLASGGPYHGVDLPAVVAWARATSAQLTASAASLPPRQDASPPAPPSESAGGEG